jgi:SP family myo-inositol transporter-like MFS transporter 13
MMEISLPLGQICDAIGRRKTVFLVCAVFTIGSLISSASFTLQNLYVGRFVVGIGVAISSIVDIAYLTEVSPQRYRGAAVGMILYFVSASLSKMIGSH